MDGVELGAKMLPTILALLLLGTQAFAGPINPAGQLGINNSAVAQNAQFNVGTGTVRGVFTAATINVHSLNADIFSATSFSGDGSAITNLSASQLLSGTVPAARISGAYSGITGLGAIASGAWNGTAIGTQYGGSGGGGGGCATDAGGTGVAGQGNSGGASDSYTYGGGGGGEASAAGTAASSLGGGAGGDGAHNNIQPSRAYTPIIKF